jgi:hypothetical protein
MEPLNSIIWHGGLSTAVPLSDYYNLITNN